MKTWNKENVYVLLVGREEISSMPASVFIEDIFEAEFDHDEDFWSDSVFTNQISPPDDMLVIAVHEPTSDDAFLLMRFCDGASVLESLRLMSIIPNLDMGTLSQSDAKERAQQLFNEIQQLTAKKSHIISSWKYTLSKYRTLSDIAHDAYADSKATVFSYKHFYYTRSRGSEFRMKEASMSQAFLNEHAKPLGTVAGLRSIFL